MDATVQELVITLENTKPFNVHVDGRSFYIQETLK
jgi:hypothetical protein